MKFNKWTVALAAVGVVSLASAARGDEQMSAVQTALSSTTLSGYVDTAATWRPGTDQGPATFGPLGTGIAGTIPRYSYAKNDGFSLNAVDIALDKSMDESQWAAGYHVEMMFGPDNPVAYTGIAGYSVSVANGLSCLRQAYLTLRTPIGNGIDWKIGVFDTIIGYESTSSPLDPNYTRSYGYTIEPTTHTGVLATYKVNDMLSVSAGIANTWTENLFLTSLGPVYESQKTYMGSMTFTAPDSMGAMKGATFTAGIVNGTDSTFLAPFAGGSQSSVYAGATLPTPITALKMGATFDWHDLHNSGAGNSSDDSVWVVGLYSSYQATDKLSFNLRGEYLSDAGAGPYSFTAVRASNAEEITATAQYSLWANVISRAEFRWDHVEQGKPFGVSSASGTNFRSNDFMLALNLIYQF